MHIPRFTMYLEEMGKSMESEVRCFEGPPWSGRRGRGQERVVPSAAALVNGHTFSPLPLLSHQGTMVMLRLLPGPQALLRIDCNF